MPPCRRRVALAPLLLGALTLYLLVDYAPPGTVVGSVRGGGDGALLASAGAGAASTAAAAAAARRRALPTCQGAFRVAIIQDDVLMFGEVQRMLFAGFAELGFDVVNTVQPACFTGPAPLCLQPDVLCVHTTACTTRMGQDLPARPLWVNLEVLRPDVLVADRPCLNPGYADTLWSSGPVWDYLHDNLDLFAEKGWAVAQYLPLRYYAGIVSSDVRYSARSEAERDIDVLFIGLLGPSPRRHAVVDGLKARGVAVTLVTNTFGLAREALIRRAKVVINVHFYTRNFETVRLFWLLSLGAFVVAEADPDRNAAVMAEYNGSMVFAPYDGMVDAVIAYLPRAAERERVAEAGYDFVRASTPGDVMRPLVDVSMAGECRVGEEGEEGVLPAAERRRAG
jgi:hypothetical protein